MRWQMAGVLVVALVCAVVTAVGLDRDRQRLRDELRVAEHKTAEVQAEALGARAEVQRWHSHIAQCTDIPATRPWNRPTYCDEIKIAFDLDLDPAALRTLLPSARQCVPADRFPAIDQLLRFEPTSTRRAELQAVSSWITWSNDAGATP